MSGTLYIVATPIGNLEDLTMRAHRILKEVDAIVCEDTRVTSKLIRGCDLPSKALTSIHEHATDSAILRIIDRLRKGASLAYVCDAGTPGVNDPGGKLVAASVQAGIPVIPIPGPSALTAAISVCGFPMDAFVYIGFMPHKKGKETALREMSARREATVFFESTHRIEKTLESLRAHLDPSRLVFMGRELTKMHETLYRGTIDAVCEALQHTSQHGEFVLIIAPAFFKT